MLNELLVEARMADYERMTAGWELRREAKRLYSKTRPATTTTTAPALEPQTGTKPQTAP
jgi:hypothetical protein